MSKMAKTIAALGVVAGLGVAALPLSSYAATTNNPASVDVLATVNGSISMTVNDEEVNVGQVMPGGEIASKSTTIGVSTNNAKGYKVEMTDNDTNTNMVQIDANGDPLNGGAAIPTGDLTATTSGWGYSIDNGTSYKAVPALGGTPAEIATKASATTGEEQTTVTFGVKAASDQAEGNYKDTVIFTATVNS